VVISNQSIIPWVIKKLHNIDDIIIYQLSFFKGDVRYTHEIIAVNDYNIQNNLYFTCGTFNKN